MTEEMWLEDEVEVLRKCPLCEGRRSSVLFNSLIDMMNRKASTTWTLNKCSHCAIAYLSPRPKKENIHKAYKNYYTHQGGSNTIKSRSASTLLNYLKMILYNVKYKGEYSFKEYFIYLVILIIYPFYLFLDSKIRNIGTVNNKKRLLDIGCGNGDFLIFANNIGWEVMGLDVDKEAVDAALSKGVNVQFGGVELLDKSVMFDMITLSHVIEHVYDPVELIQKCYNHLNPGGKLWLGTPNINSIGLDVYKAYWRGLEAPRHLMIYNISMLTKLLSEAGFVNINQKKNGLSGIYMGLHSEKSLDELMHDRHFYNRLMKYPKIFFVEIVQLIFKKKSEFITLVAYK